LFGSRLRSGESGTLFGGPLVTYANQCFREAPLLLIIKARKEGLSGVGKLLLICGALAHIIGFLMHTVDDIKGAFLFRAVAPLGVLAIRPGFADVAHCTLESGPVLFLVRCESQVSPDSCRLSIDLVRKLVGGQFRATCAVLSTG
jgi:hypothetical protein